MAANKTAKKVVKTPVTKAVKPVPVAKPKAMSAKPAVKAKAAPVKAVAKPVSKPAQKGKVAPAKAPMKAPAKTPPAKAPVKPVLPVKAAKVPARARKVEEAQEPAPVKSPFNAKELAVFKDLLLKLRDRIIDEMNFLARDNLNRSSKDAAGDLSSYSFHMADQGTDNFDREFAANLLSGEQDVLYEIEEALRRVDGDTYGVCEMSGLPIERERLKVLPYARYSVAVQSQMEKGKPRFRPFRRVSIQQAGGSEG